MKLSFSFLKLFKPHSSNRHVSNFFHRMRSYRRHQKNCIGVLFYGGFLLFTIFRTAFDFERLKYSGMYLLSNVEPDIQHGVGASSALERLWALLQQLLGCWRNLMRCGIPYGLMDDFCSFPEQSCPFSTIPSPSFSLSFFIPPYFSLWETLFSSCPHDGLLRLSDCKLKAAKSVPCSACIDIVQSVKEIRIRLIYLYRAIDFLLLSMNQKVASDYWFVNLHVFCLHCTGQF